METMIQSNSQKQRDFQACFQFKAPNKHLPYELQRHEFVKQNGASKGTEEQSHRGQKSQTIKHNKDITDALSLVNSDYDTIFGDNQKSPRSKALASDNTFVREMASHNLKDFKARSRAKIVPRVAKRLEIEEQKTRDLHSAVSTSVIEKKTAKQPKSMAAAVEKVMSYLEIKMWNQKYNLDGKSVYQLDAEFASLFKVQVQDLQTQIKKLQSVVHTSELEAEQSK